jgi:hypothetical protein
LLGPGEIDPLSLAYANARELAARALAEFIARVDPEICAIAGIDAGDAFALATRFDRQWAYRGAQALFWQARFRAHEVHDRYLRSAALRPFDRRGLLLVDGECDGFPLSLIATQFGTTRETYVQETRFMRDQVRKRTRCLIFAQHPTLRTDLRSRNIAELARDERHDLRVYVRGADVADFAVTFMSP